MPLVLQHNLQCVHHKTVYSMDELLTKKTKNKHKMQYNLYIARQQEYDIKL